MFLHLNQFSRTQKKIVFRDIRASELPLYPWLHSLVFVQQVAVFFFIFL